MILEGWSSFPLSNFILLVCHVLDFISNNQIREGGGVLRGSGVISLWINEKINFSFLVVFLAYPVALSLDLGV
jgi:hypothetical protein